jgi:hypothetical protein
VRVNALSSKFEKQRIELEEGRSTILAKLRGLQRRRSAAVASITFAESFRESVAGIQTPASADIAVSVCPFCASGTNHAEHEANRLSEAIAWLNNELRLSPYMRESFIEDEKKLSSEIEVVRQELMIIQGHLEKLDKQTEDLKNKRSMSELAMKAKLRVEATLELLVAKSTSDLVFKKEILEKDIKDLSSQLRKYNMAERLEELDKLIESSMQEIGKKFDFEESYRPINLKFSLDTFDLWHERSDGRKVFLRAMGSGANWLYCHLTLFLALHRVFASMSNVGCKIPPILFLDQPTQVYFPNYLNDDLESFDAKEIAEGTPRQNNVDEDLKAVVGMYDELVRFCDGTERISGFRPQIIVTDHADHLKLGGDTSFDSFVRARWRSRGFIAF